MICEDNIGWMMKYEKWNIFTPVPSHLKRRITSQILNFISAEMQNLVVWGRLVLKSHTVPAEMNKRFQVGSPGC